MNNAHQLLVEPIRPGKAAHVRVVTVLAPWSRRLLETAASDMTITQHLLVAAVGPIVCFHFNPGRALPISLEI
jgi:hypothetical protein